MHSVFIIELYHNNAENSAECSEVKWQLWQNIKLNIIALLKNTADLSTDATVCPQIVPNATVSCSPRRGQAPGKWLISR